MSHESGSEARRTAVKILDLVDKGAFVSYSQNREDVILRRILREHQWDSFIEVGAADPMWNSTTYAFYWLGHRGLTLDPRPDVMAAHEDLRPGDFQICAAAGSRSGFMQLWVPRAGTHSTLVPELGRKLVTNRSVKSVETDATTTWVKTVTLAEATGDLDLGRIGFMTIDVEGFELEVLHGVDLDYLRPMVIVFESLPPPLAGDQVKVQLLDKIRLCRELLKKNHYELVYQDGINDFWIADDIRGAQVHPLAPPNYYDNFISARELVMARALLEDTNWERDGE